MFIWLTACPSESTESGGPRGELAILSFTSSADLVQPCTTVVLAWCTTGADVVSISMDEVTLVSTFAAEGSVESRPICERTTFVLTAEYDEASISSSLDVVPDWPMPAIYSLRAEPSRGIVGQDVALRFETTGARRIKVERDSELIRDIEVPPAEVLPLRPGMAVVRTSSAINEIVVSAFNPDYSASEELIVHADELSIEQFIVHPPAAFGATRATIYWRAHAEILTLFHEEVEVPSFPGTPSGSMELDLIPPTYLTFTAFTANFQNQVFFSFEPPQQEVEPNDEPLTAGYVWNYAVAGDLRADDRDIYTMFFDRPTTISIYTVDRDSNGCDVDSTVILSTIEYIELGRHRGGGPASPMGECALARPEEQEFLRDLEGQLYITVLSELGETGDYLLFAEIQPN